MHSIHLFLTDPRSDKSAGKVRRDDGICGFQWCWEEHSNPAHPTILWPQRRDGKETSVLHAAILLVHILQKSCNFVSFSFTIGYTGRSWHSGSEHPVAAFSDWDRGAGAGTVCDHHRWEHSIWAACGLEWWHHHCSQRGQCLQLHHGLTTGRRPHNTNLHART